MKKIILGVLLGLSIAIIVVTFWLLHELEEGVNDAIRNMNESRSGRIK